MISQPEQVRTPVTHSRTPASARQDLILIPPLLLLGLAVRVLLPDGTQQPWPCPPLHATQERNSPCQARRTLALLDRRRVLTLGLTHALVIPPESSSEEGVVERHTETEELRSVLTPRESVGARLVLATPMTMATTTTTTVPRKREQRATVTPTSCNENPPSLHPPHRSHSLPSRSSARACVRARGREREREERNAPSSRERQRVLPFCTYPIHPPSTPLSALSFLSCLGDQKVR
jgi:hypothetical protein